LLSRLRIVKAAKTSSLLTMILNVVVGTLSSVLCMSAFAEESTIPPSSFTLIIRMTPAACALDPELQKLRQCQDGFTLTISSLQAERTSGKRLENCSHDQTNLSPLQERVVERVMPDKQLRDEDWQRNGSCTGMSPTLYFRTIATYAQRLKIPSELASPRDTVLTKSYIINKLQQLNPGLTDKSILLRCTAESGREFPVLTELRSCYNTQGQYDNCPAYIKSNCPSSVVILAAP
jgi:ribonuclease T2